MPKGLNEDCLAVLRLGFWEGWNIFDLFGFGDRDGLISERAGDEGATR
jgi:hypothetical protein